MKTIEKQRTQKATRPASKWRNHWLAICIFKSNGKMRNPGERFLGKRDWPSRDTAETYAQKREAELPEKVKYLGAFPAEGT